MKNKEDFEPTEHPNELVEIIQNLLFKPIEHLEWFINKPPEEKKQVAREYIQDYLYNDQF
jgi:hypothetical protein